MSKGTVNATVRPTEESGGVWHEMKTLSSFSDSYIYCILLIVFCPPVGVIYLILKRTVDKVFKIICLALSAVVIVFMLLFLFINQGTSVVILQKELQLEVGHSVRIEYKSAYPTLGYAIYEIVTDEPRLVKIENDRIYALEAGACKVYIQSMDRKSEPITVIITECSSISNDTEVRITYSGIKYHKLDGCETRTSIILTLEQAVEMKYTPCKVCKPPSLGD